MKADPALGSHSDEVCSTDFFPDYPRLVIFGIPRPGYTLQFREVVQADPAERLCFHSVFTEKQRLVALDHQLVFASASRSGIPELSCEAVKTVFLLAKELNFGQGWRTIVQPVAYEQFFVEVKGTFFMQMDRPRVCQAKARG